MPSYMVETVTLQSPRPKS